MLLANHDCIGGLKSYKRHKDTKSRATRVRQDAAIRCITTAKVTLKSQKSGPVSEIKLSPHQEIPTIKHNLADAY